MLHEHHRYKEDKYGWNFEPVNLEDLLLLPCAVYVQAFSKQGIVLIISQFTFNISSVSTHKRNATSHNNKKLETCNFT